MGARPYSKTSAYFAVSVDGDRLRLIGVYEHKSEAEAAAREQNAYVIQADRLWK